MRRAFTLIELLVVISIIALLIAILLPVLSSVKESSRRIECGINSRSVAQGQMTLSTDNKGNYRLNAAGFGQPVRYRWTYFKSFDAVRQDHFKQNGQAISLTRDWGTNTNWLTPKLFWDMSEAGVQLDTFACPNRGQEYIQTSVSGIGYTEVDRSQRDDWNWVRIAFFMMGGVDQQAIDPGGPDGLRWVSPTSMDDPGDLPLTACVNEWGGPDLPKVTYPHGPKGMIQEDAASNANKAENSDSDGGNVTANDGSTEFVGTADAYRFNSHLNANTSGYWNYVRSYDEVNPGYTGP